MSELKDRIQETIAREPVVAFVKGTHEQAYCGNSERAMQALRTIALTDATPNPFRIVG